MSLPSLEQAMLAQTQILKLVIHELSDQSTRSAFHSTDVEDILLLMQHHCDCLQIAMITDLHD